MKKPIQMKVEGYEVVEKKADTGGNSGRIYVPKHWVGKRVIAILAEETEGIHEESKLNAGNKTLGGKLKR